MQMQSKPAWVIARTALGLTIAFGVFAGPAMAEEQRSYLERTVKISAQIRARWEATDGSNFAATTADSWLLTRTRLGVDYKPKSWLNFFGQIQDSRVMFYHTRPSGSIADPFEFRQGYVEIGTLEGPGVKAKVGRQELFIGSTRLIVTGDWGNVTRSFDVFRGTVTTKAFGLDLIGGSPVLADPNRMDRHKPGDHFYVAYSSFKKLLPGASVEPYLMARTLAGAKSKDGAIGTADTLYIGGRVIGKTKGHFDYTVEGVREAGSYVSDDIRAWGYAAGGGWTVTPAVWKLHFSSDYLFATGDNGRKDGGHQQFDYMYGNNQPLISVTGLFAWRNISAWRAGADFSPLKKLNIKVDYHNYWLATVSDGLYNASGTRTVMNAAAASRHVGEGVDTFFIVPVNGKTTVGAGIGTLAPGSYLVESHKTSGYVYPFLYFTRQL